MFSPNYWFKVLLTFNIKSRHGKKPSHSRITRKSKNH
jgi:hypothetical protein